ncbi:structure-specific endonuclease subunit slx1 isoform X2 [Euphorbia lathyris]|uniref:structure-specific endonuclease subunit slx1 isoform X2 n=1 Tax=Euphorbia lathyris TaxID=212925 RepID=UPI003314152B
MRKRTATARSERPNNAVEEGNQNEEDKIKEGNGFYACYLLTSLCPRFKGHTYIGFTVNPKRRIRQHNGEIRSGACRTKKRRPWEMVFCIYGFPTNVSALQFEWAWQHPMESLHVRQAAAALKSFSGVANKIKLAYTMLNLPAWKSLNITVNYFSTKYSKLSAGCPSLPHHMKVQVLPIDELPCYTTAEDSFTQSEDDELGFKDNGENDSTNSDNGAVKERSIELNVSAIDEFRRANLGACDSSNSSKEDVNKTVTLSSDKPHNIDEISPQKFGWFEEQQHLRSSSEDYSPLSKVDFNSTVRTASSVFTTTFSMDTDDREDLSNEERLSDNVDEGQPSLNRYTLPYEIEVIDLLSPSPDCRIISGRKKRRVSTAFPVIIDLT